MNIPWHSSLREARALTKKGVAAANQRIKAVKTAATARAESSTPSVRSVFI